MAKKKQDIEVDPVITSILKSIKKKFGNKCDYNTLKDLSQKEITSISTGSIRLDSALVVPFPPGIHMISGPYDTGKTTLSLRICSEAQKNNRDVFYVDQEGKVNSYMTKGIPGLDQDKMHVLYFDSGEDAVDSLSEIAGSVKNCFIVVDSIPKLVPNIIMTNSASDATMGKLGALMGLFMNKMLPKCRKNNVTVLLINQVRSSIGGYGPKWSLPGGKALEHDTIQQIQLSRRKSDLWIKDGVPIGQTVTAHIMKNKFGPAFIDVPVELRFAYGPDEMMELIKLAHELAIFSKGGAGWYTIPPLGVLKEEHKLQGEQNIYDFLKENDEYSTRLTAKIKECLL